VKNLSIDDVDELLYAWRRHTKLGKYSPEYKSDPYRKKQMTRVTRYLRGMLAEVCRAKRKK
jgi:hypothetical protein